MNKVKMTPADLERPEDGGGDSTVPVLVLLSLLACGAVIFVSSNQLFYWEGLGKRRLGPPSLMIYGALAWGMLLLAIAGIVMSLKGADSRRHHILAFLLAADLLVTPLSCSAFGPGYQARTQGFAERAKRTVTLTSETRKWLRTEATAHPGKRRQWGECPASVQAAFRELTAPWPRWEIYFDPDGTARLASGGGMDYEWGLAIGTKQNPVPPASPKEYRIAVSAELAAYHKLSTE